MPSFMNRSCQRQTQVFDLPVRRMISLVPTPSALERMIAARQACFCEALRSLVIASSRPRGAAFRPEGGCGSDWRHHLRLEDRSCELRRDACHERRPRWALP